MVFENGAFENRDLDFAILVLDPSLILQIEHKFSRIKNENVKIKITIFKLTVLEDYWELEPGIGTKIKLRFSTFSSLRSF